jgi:hypothetical protein
MSLDPYMPPRAAIANSQLQRTRKRSHRSKSLLAICVIIACLFLVMVKHYGRLAVDLDFGRDRYVAFSYLAMSIAGVVAFTLFGVSIRLERA